MIELLPGLYAVELPEDGYRECLVTNKNHKHYGYLEGAIRTTGFDYFRRIENIEDYTLLFVSDEVMEEQLRELCLSPDEFQSLLHSHNIEGRVAILKLK